MLCILLSACMIAGLFTSLDGTFSAEAASDDMDKYSYCNEDGEEVTVWVSSTKEFTYTSFPFGYSTRGGYVFAKIDTVGNGNDNDIKFFWLSKGGPCGDGTVCDSWEAYKKSGKLLESDRVGENNNWAYGNYEQAMFWFKEDELKFGGADSVVGTMVSDYLQAYMHKYFDFVFYENFSKSEPVHCEIIWGNSVQIHKNCVMISTDTFWNEIKGCNVYIPVWNESSLSLNRSGNSVLKSNEWTVYEDGSGLTGNEGCDEIKTGSRTYKVSRVSPAFKSHCSYFPSHNEKICHSSAEMDAAQKRLVGTDGKQSAVSGTLGKNIKEQATGYATPKSAAYKKDHWNARVDVSIDKDKMFGQVKVAFYDCNNPDRKTPAGISYKASPSSLPYGSSDVAVKGWTGDVPSGYAVAYNRLDRFPAFHVAQGSGSISFSKYDAGNRTMYEGVLKSDSYTIGSLPNTEYTVVWIPIEEQKPFIVQYWDIDTGAALDDRGTEVSSYAEGERPGRIDVTSTLALRYNNKYEIAWSLGAGYDGFFEVRGSSPELYRSYDKAVRATAYDSSTLSLNDPYVGVGGQIYDEAYTVLWVPVINTENRKNRIDIIYIDSETGEQIGVTQTVKTGFGRGENFLPKDGLPEGYRTTEDGKYKSRGAYLASDSVKSISEGYDSLLTGNNIKLKYDPSDYSFVIPYAAERFLTCKLYIPATKEGAARLYTHYYDAATGRAIGKTGTFINSITTGSRIPEFCITDSMPLPSGYYYKGGAPMTVSGTSVAKTADDFTEAKKLSTISGKVVSRTGGLYGSTTGKVPKTAAVVCMWIPLEAGDVSIIAELINGDTGAAIADSKVYTTADKGSVFNVLDVLKESIPDGFEVDDTGAYTAKAAYSKTVNPLDITYDKMGSHTALAFLNSMDYSISVPNEKGSFSIRVFIPVRPAPAENKKVNIIYYNILNNETIARVTGIEIDASKTVYTPSDIKDSLKKGSVVYGRVVSATSTYYTTSKGKNIGVYGYGNFPGLREGTVRNAATASIKVPSDAREINIYIGMSAGDYILSVFFVDADTGVTISRLFEVGHYENHIQSYFFDKGTRILYNGIAYAPVSYAEDASCKYPSAVFYHKYYTGTSLDASYDSCLSRPNYESPFVSIPRDGNGGRFRISENAVAFGPWPSLQGRIINAYIPCRRTRPVEIHCVDKNRTSSTDFLKDYVYWVLPGADVAEQLDEITVDGVVYRPMTEGDHAIAFDDSKSVISYDAAVSSSYGEVTHKVARDTSDGTCDAVTKEAGKTGKHTVMYVLYEPDSPRVTVKYVTLKDGNVDRVLLTRDGGSAKYGKKYFYSGDTSVTVSGTTYNVTGEGEVLAYGEYEYATALADTLNRKGVPAVYDGSGKWTTGKKYNSNLNGTLYIPVEEDGYPVTVKYITLRSDGGMNRIVAGLDGGNAVVGKKYTYEGKTSVVGTDGKTYTVLGEKEAFAYGSSSYKDALDDTGNTKGTGATYKLRSGKGTWTTDKKVKKAAKGTLYIPVRTGIPVRIIYINVKTGKPVRETEGAPGEEGKKYVTPYEPAIIIDETTTYLPDPENPPKHTFTGESYGPSLKTPVNDPSGPSVTTPKVPSGTDEIIIYIPVKKGDPPKTPDTSLVGIDNSGDVTAKIRSDEFDVEKAIPSTEYEYAEIKAGAYILKLKIHSVSGLKTYTVNVSQTVHHEVTKYDADGNPDGTDTTTSTETGSASASRAYSYWLIDEIGYYTLDNVKIGNGSLDSELTYSVTSRDYTFPALTYTAKAAASAHITEPQSSGISVTAPDLYYLDGVITSGTTAGAYAAAEASKIGQIMCVNDSLIFGGVAVLSSTPASGTAPAPNLTPVEKTPPRLTLKTSALRIPAERKNILYDDSKGVATYVPEVVYKGSSVRQTVDVKYINAVKVHTPVVNKERLDDDNLQYVQAVSADRKKYQVVVGRSESYGSSGNENITSDFSIVPKLDGQHINEKGYGKRDYTKYILGYGSTVNNTAYPKGVQVRFPFDVVADVGNDGMEGNDIVLEAGKWYPIYARYYVPEWVKEGTYTCKIRVLACNAEGDYDAMGKNANLSDTDYAAYDEFEVEVSGKMYGLTITSNSSGAPDWKNVFMLGGKIKNANPKKYSDGTFGSKFSKDLRYYYMAGLRNELGLDMWTKLNGKKVLKDARYVYPLLAGSSPALKGSGMLKSGYTWNFRLETVGRATANEGSALIITPTFYWVSRDGKKREKVDLWYSDRVDGKTYNYIKAGSELDRKNVFTVHAASDTMGIPAAEIEFADAIRGSKDITTANTAIYTYGSIRLANNTKTYTNDAYAKLFASRQTTFSEVQLRQLKQTWYFRYGLPDVYHLCAEGYDVDGYVKKNGGCTYKEDFWKKDGYLVVHFDIEAYEKADAVTGKRKLALSYTNTAKNVADGMCDMWKTEGFQNSRTDSNGKKFTFEDGDVIIVALPGSTGKNPPTNHSEDNEVNRLN